MGSSPILPYLLPLSVVIGAVVFLTTGSALFGVVAFLLDAVPVSIIYASQLKSKRERISAAQDRLSRYSIRDR
jgi:hypothetical protein